MVPDTKAIGKMISRMVMVWRIVILFYLLFYKGQIILNTMVFIRRVKNLVKVNISGVMVATMMGTGLTTK
jgi:hypothetical protein